MPRCYAKEAAWEREKYDQIKFRVSKAEGARFRAELEAAGMSMAQWFRLALAAGLAAPAAAQGAPPAAPGAAAPKKRRSRSPCAETVRGWVEMSRAGVSYRAIADASDGYEHSTVRKRVLAALAAGGPGAGAGPAGGPA